MDSREWAQLTAIRQQQAREREQEMRAWAAEVRARLNSERCKFMDEFDENEKRIFGLIP